MDGTMVIDGKRVDYARDEVEFAALGHLRGWCHDSRVCPICDASRKRV